MKVLIAEDEYYARRRLEKILGECKEKTELVASVEDGQSAVEFLEQHPQVDVVVTDIIMPRMDGLQLAKWIQANVPYVQVIIVSGYEEFDYARKAIECEVKQYLIKPVKKEQLVRVLLELDDKQESYRRDVEEGIQERLIAVHNEYASAKQILNSSILMEQFLPDFAVSSVARDSRLAVLQLERRFQKEDVAVTQRICAQKLKGQCFDGFFCKSNDEFIITLSSNNRKAAKGVSDKEMLEEILSYIRTMLHTGVTIGMSGVFRGRDYAYEAYKESLYAMNSRLMSGWNQVYEYQNPKWNSGYFEVQDERALIGALQASDYERASGLIHSLLWRDELIRSGDVNAYYDVILNILRTINKYYRSVYHGEGEKNIRVDIMFSRRYDLYNFRHPEELEEYIQDILLEICNRGQYMARNSQNAIIQDILHYVEHNYRYDLSLQELAEKKYFMNPSYLSRLFKRAVGKPFSCYVIGFRIEKAKELLNDRQLRICDIAAQVGYNNTSHFIQSFKKICKCTPEEMRSRLNQESAACKDEGKESDILKE